MADAEAQLMELLFRAYIVVAEPGPDDQTFATCAACNTASDPNTFRWCAQSDIREIKNLADQHIRAEHLAVAVLTIDAMRDRYGPVLAGDVQEMHQYRANRLLVGVAAIRDRLAAVTRQDLVLRPVATEVHLLGVRAIALELLREDKLITAVPPVALRLHKKEAAGAR